MRLSHIAAAAILAAGCSSDDTAGTATTVADLSIHIEFTLADGTDGSQVNGWYDDCHGNGGYDDFRPGMNVTVRDGDGAIVGVGSMLADVTAAHDRAFGGCTLIGDITVEDAKFYSVAIGSRGDLTFAKTELEANGWQATLTLG